LSAETCHEFIEWCGLVEGHENNHMIVYNQRVYKNDLYFNFVEEYPDYGPKAKMTISRTRFYKWISSYANYKNINVEEGRDHIGRWVIFKDKNYVTLGDDEPPF